MNFPAGPNLKQTKECFVMPQAGDEPNTAACPAETAGRRLGLIIAERDRLQAELDRLRQDSRGPLLRRAEELEDLQSLLEDKLEWLTPTSAAGALAVFSLAYAATDDLVDGSMTVMGRRSFRRLMARLMEYLCTEAGVTPTDMGLGSYVLTRPAEEAVRTAFAS